MKIAVIGAGISGLTVAILLHKYGFDVEVYEAAKELIPLGLGINLQPHATKVLAELNILDELALNSVSISDLEFRCNKNLCIYAEARGLNAGYDFPQLAIHRGTLQQILLKHYLGKIGAHKLHLSHKLVAFEESGNEVKMQFLNQVSGLSINFTADLLIGADGINSIVRNILHRDKNNYHFEGIMMWRGVTKSKKFSNASTIFVCGNLHVQLVVYPITTADDNNECYLNWVVEILDKNATELSENCWNVKGDVNEFIHHFKAWNFTDPNIVELFHKAEQILKFPMVDREPLKSWGSNKTTLIGDAAHPMYPRGANGASQAIVDAQILTKYIKEEADITKALKLYEKERIKATSKIVLNNRITNQIEILSLVENRCSGVCIDQHSCISQDEIANIVENYKRHANATVAQVNKI